MESSYRLSIEEVQNLLVASLVVGAAFTAFKGSTSIRTGLIYFGIGLLLLSTREFGQRTVAQWMDAYVDMELSLEGSATTVLGAIVAFLTQMPVILLFPVSNSFSGKKYEHWGKTIDAIWMKRQFWIVFGGLVTLFMGWLATYSLGIDRLAEAYILFALFQMLPFDYHSIPTGDLDGAYVLRWSGFYWLAMFGFAIVAAVFTF